MTKEDIFEPPIAETDVDHILDATGLLCPEPVMMLHNAVRDANTGEVIQVMATDPSTMKDILRFCDFLGHELIGQKTLGDAYYHWIRKV
ncbi:sulfurtransferase TusA [Marinibactrum halimedae]|uniref:Sulfurtransferase TusD n=1 Tax=Marinibactrum halimedae TaxID=1444977 RepID=A0AA37WNP3_9GAMM|nr:sulfurtransferase TusA [Marinibactrum halimedae]MCD9457848.1 sulfurtransferase TusA [Marinibactrum halimedae]GLS26331.1 sulfurtransferase TusD [Marinibactrum halimedae]